MKQTEQDRLLREILGGEGGLRTTSLAAGLKYLQRRRRRKRWTQIGLAGGTALLVVGLCFFLTVQSAHRPRSGGVMVATPGADAGLRVISDEELFALFPNRAMALIGPRGHQQLVFLDRGGASERP
jgi:peptidoglycan/LPS O-acetylase OafA/YrhL